MPGPEMFVLTSGSGLVGSIAWLVDDLEALSGKSTKCRRLFCG